MERQIVSEKKRRLAAVSELYRSKKTLQCQLARLNLVASGLPITKGGGCSGTAANHSITAIRMCNYLRTRFFF